MKKISTIILFIVLAIPIVLGVCFFILEKNRNNAVPTGYVAYTDAGNKKLGYNNIVLNGFEKECKSNKKTTEYYGYKIDNDTSINIVEKNKDEECYSETYDLLLSLTEDLESNIVQDKSELLRNNNGFIYSIMRTEKGYMIYSYYKGKVIDLYYVASIPKQDSIVKKLHKGMSVKELSKLDETIKLNCGYSNVVKVRLSNGKILDIRLVNPDNIEPDKEYVDGWNIRDDEIHLIGNLLEIDRKVLSNGAK